MITIKEISTGKEWKVPEELTKFLVDNNAKTDNFSKYDSEDKEIKFPVENVKDARLEYFDKWAVNYNYDWDGCYDDFDLDPSVFIVQDTDYIAKEKIFSVLNSHYRITHLPNSRQHEINKVLLDIAKILGIPLSQIE